MKKKRGCYVATHSLSRNQGGLANLLTCKRDIEGSVRVHALHWGCSGTNSVHVVLLPNTLRISPKKFWRGRAFGCLARKRYHMYTLLFSTYNSILKWTPFKLQMVSVKHMCPSNSDKYKTTKHFIADCTSIL